MNKTIGELSDRELLIEAVLRDIKGNNGQMAKEQIERAGRWGTCGGCPTVDGTIRPDLCDSTQTEDHNISWTQDGDFKFLYRLMTKAEVFAWIQGFDTAKERYDQEQ